jgi:hypothetical protein
MDFLQTSVCLLVLFFINLKVNYGEIRLFPAIIFIVAFYIERITLGKIIAKFYYSCYTIIEKLNSKLRGKIKNDKTNKND